jgi:hypothetical protein
MMVTQEGEFASAFDWAVVRLATYFPASASQARLLFGSVSLITKDRPRPPTSRGADSHKVGKSKSGKVFFRRTVLSASDAIAWYRNVGAGGITTPVPTEPSEVEKKKDGIAILATPFEDDPQWPSLGVPLGTDLFSNAGGPGDPAPFRGPGAPRIHRRFGDNAGFEAVIADDSAISFLKRRLHFDLSDYIEYLGGLALVVPDPVLRRVQHFLVSAQNADGPERVIYRMVPRPSQSFDDLKLTVLERRSNLLSRFETVDVPADGLVTVQSGLPFDQTGYAISHRVQGVIAYQQPLPFIRAVKVSLIGLSGRRVQVPQTESPRSPTDSYEIVEYAHETPINVGEERHDAIVKVVEAEQRRVRRTAAKQYRQTWFDGGQRNEAISFLRGQLARARLSVMVADPYFGARQILQFLHAVPRTQIDFIILTSRLAFESEYAEAIDAPQDGAQDQAEVSAGLARETERLTSFTRSLATLHTRGMKSVTALVLSGKTPALHDRFLVIDDEVLFLGNSLNALGERASLILSVPDSEPILAKLQAMVRLALPFETYSSQRRRASATPSEGA